MNGELIFNKLAKISSQPCASYDLSDLIIFSISKVVVNLLCFLSDDLCICDTDCKGLSLLQYLDYICFVCVIIIDANVISY
jgi:hypothetical protein